MMVPRFLIPLLLLPVTVAAESSMSAEAFDTYTRGKTLFYGYEGKAYGVERYLDGRQVIWSFLDGDCKKGFWYESGGLICFLYEDRDDPQCWSFERSGQGLIARFENLSEPTELYEAQDLGEDMVCLGPKVGV